MCSFNIKKVSVSDFLIKKISFIPLKFVKILDTKVDLGGNGNTFIQGVKENTYTRFYLFNTFYPQT